MRDLILRKLKAIERPHRVKILYAVESGSRAWGFASPDSDYDVRFVFARHPRDVLTIREPRDVIEDMDGDLDCSGWELKKALALYTKTNAALFEWLDSPIVYIDDLVLAPALRALAERVFSPRTCFHHYRAMAENNYRAYLQGELVRLKKYLYGVRSVLACEWIVAHGTMPPTAFSRLVDDRLPHGPVRDAVNQLLNMKRADDELAEGPRLATLHAFLDEALVRLRTCETPVIPRVEVEPIDDLYRSSMWRCFPAQSDWS